MTYLYLWGLSYFPLHSVTLINAPYFQGIKPWYQDNAGIFVSHFLLEQMSMIIMSERRMVHCP